MSNFSLDPSLYANGNTETEAETELPANGTANESVLAEALSPQNISISELLKKKRKAREHKACLPCRQRKVKCDQQTPCKTCLARGHVELCSYTASNKRQALDVEGDTQSAQSILVNRYEFDLLLKRVEMLESSVAELRQELTKQTVSQVDPALRASMDGS